MKKSLPYLTFVLGLVVMLAIQSFNGKQLLEKYILVHEKDIAKQQPGPHKGGGQTIAYPFFDGVEGFDIAFRKRTLKAGSSIGYHLQESDEVYYILEGTGEMQMNGDSFPVKAGDAILTRPGSSHGLKPAEGKDLTLLISYRLK
ncbi:MAG: cupin domain-containing protein [Chitinophagaceae bacterium]|nr:MAG: cupin domain-containing protein [Chitinophagaceae bacterium]